MFHIFFIINCLRLLFDKIYSVDIIYYYLYICWRIYYGQIYTVEIIDNSILYLHVGLLIYDTINIVFGNNETEQTRPIDREVENRVELALDDEVELEDDVEEEDLESDVEEEVERQLHISRRVFRMFRQIHSKLEKNTHKSYNVTECSICLETLEDTENILTSCKHVFHQTCFEKWIEIDRSCPLCRNIK